MAAFDLSRNHYDRIGHFAFGFFILFTVREIYIRKKLIKTGGWQIFTFIAIVVGLAAFWELIEWWAVLASSSDVGTNFLGAQGDIWDAHWDMFLALIGAAVALCLSKWHDKSMRSVPST